MSKLWKTLTREQKGAWGAWARSNPVLLPDFNVRRVSAQKAFSVVMNNRAVAGVSLAPTVVPAAVTWLGNVFSTRDAGPYTTNTGFIGFRAELAVPDNTKFFIWASPPCGVEIAAARARLRFVGVMTVSPALVPNDVTPNQNAAYEAVNGSFDGPGADGNWGAVDMFVHYRVYEYKNGQLGPGFGLKTGRIVVEL